MKVKIWLSMVFSLVFLTCGANASQLTISVVEPQYAPVNDIVVYVTPVSGVEDLTPNVTPLYIDQKDKKFAPYITVMQKGHSINFVNQDDITHHIYSVSGENRFEFKIKEGEEKSINNFDTVEEVAMGCNIHDWMSGYVLVVDTPLFGKTDNEGKINFNLPDLGVYQITVWHPQLDVNKNSVSQTVNVTSQQKKLTITLPKVLLPIPEQVGQDEFDFLEEY